MNDNIIAIGGLGGSGTRVVAEILIKSGVYLGNDLNNAFDNLIFTRLFKNPAWYKTSSSFDIEKRFSVFLNYMKHDSLNLLHLKELFYSSRSNPTYESDFLFYIKCLKLLINPKKNRRIWGWKEPNSQILLDEIIRFIPGIKYIHVLRNGLDMAYSGNTQQMKNWGWKFDINLSKKISKEERIVKQLDFWIKSTERVIKNHGFKFSHFYLLKLSDLCNSPEKEINELLEFCEITLPSSTLNVLYDLPKLPNSHNRYKNHSINIFSQKQIDFVSKMGFKIN